jgi:peptidoglycan hydrolase FlgJ
MSAPVNSPGFYADFNGLAALKTSAAASNPAALREAARQFESLFTSMVLKSMREANLGPGLGDSDATNTYQEMYDQQLAVQMSQGKGLGLAEMLVQQLTRSGLKGTAPVSGAEAGAAVTPSSTPISVPTTAQRISFVQRVQPLADEAAGQMGVAPDTLIAQAALETGWGQHLPASPNGSSSANLFGIKAGGSWQGATATASTVEYTQGTAATTAAKFRAYDSDQASARDLVALVSSSPRYAAALGAGDDVGAYAAGLQRGGYATDPDYVKKMVATAQSLQELRASGVLNLSARVSISAGESST